MVGTATRRRAAVWGSPLVGDDLKLLANFGTGDKRAAECPMYALVNGFHKSIDGVQKRIDDVRTDLGRLHEDHKRIDEQLRAAGG